ncbi:MAG: hypothetical protein KDE59_00285 [Anaerolineales bacterium]|nr:hypothetical protein [Anaerolineales bacterium]
MALIKTKREISTPAGTMLAIHSGQHREQVNVEISRFVHFGVLVELERSR